MRYANLRTGGRMFLLSNPKLVANRRNCYAAKKELLVLHSAFHRSGGTLFSADCELVGNGRSGHDDIQLCGQYRFWKKYEQEQNFS